MRTRHHTVLVDTCFGQGKTATGVISATLTPAFLDDLKAAGVSPGAVDYVLCTHLHLDHVGWNTRLDQGKWVPTFPNARYLFVQSEWEHWKAVPEKSFNYHPIRESVLPVVEAGLADFVAPDHVIEDGLHLEPLPGHTPGHAGLVIESGGRRAVMSGDLMHHPVQMAHPEWPMGADVDPERAHQSRRAFLERTADEDILMLAAHFPTPTAGRVVSTRSAWRLQSLT